MASKSKSTSTSNKDAREERRSWLIAAGMLGGTLLVLFVIFELRVRYASADAMDGYAVLGDELLVVDRLHGGDGESSPPGGARLFLLDAATGAVTKRRRVSESSSFVSVVDGVVWLRVYKGAFEAFDAKTLEPRVSEKELLRRTPALRALTGEEEGGCLDVKMKAWRFTDETGRFVAFRFGDGTIVSVSSRDCPSRNNLEAYTGKLADGRIVGLRRTSGSTRDALVIGEGTNAKPVGSLSYLEGTLLSRGGDDRPPSLVVSAPDDVFVVRRNGTKQKDPSDVVRVSLSSGTEKWAARIDDGRTRIDQADLLGGHLFVRSGSRLTVIDVESGAVRWHRGE